MLSILSFAFLVAFRIAACSIQVPELTDCSGGQKTSGLNIINITVTDAEAGKTVKVDALAEVTETIGENPQLKMTVAKPNGAQLPCVPEVLPCDMNLCGGTTDIEKEVSKEWNGQCPVKPGLYNARLEFDVPAGLTTKLYFGDGNVVVTLKIEDGETLYSCESFPVKFNV